MSKSVFPMLMSAVVKRLLLCAPALLIAPTALATAGAAVDHKAQLAANYGQLPLGFEANRGQFDAPVRYLAQGQGYRLFLTDDETVLSLRARHASSADTTAVVRSRLLGAQSQSRVLAEQLQPGRSHYFHGKDAARWVHGVEHFGRVRYQQVYPGVDLVYYGTQGQLEYDFELAPQADPRQIRMRYSGVSGATLSARGELLLHTAGGDVTLKKPEVYQNIGGQRSAVAGRYTYRRHADAVDVAFELGDYDRNRALVIDPVLIYSSYLGGSGNDFASGGTYGIAVNAKGELYVIGSTQSANFPTQSPRQPAHAADGGTFDVFVSKFAADGQSLVYSTYLGGSGSDQGFGIALNTAGEAYITGSTNSVDFPVSAALYPNRSGNTDPEVTASDAFVSRISADGQTLVYSSYLGGSDDDNAQYGSDVGYSIALDSGGAFYVAGRTSSVHTSNSDPDNPTTAVLFPTTPGAVQTTPGSGSAADAFVTKFAADGQSLAYSTLLGGSGNELAYAIAVGASQQAYVTGITQSTDFPLQSALQGSSGGGTDAFVASLAANGQALRYSTYLGGSGTDTAYAIAVSGAGRAYLTGSTGSANFPTKSALDATIGGSSDAFVSIIAADGTLDYSSFLGGASSDVGHGIAIDGSGLIDVVGYSSSADFPVKDPVQAASAGGSEAFVSQFAADVSSLVFGTLLGGSSTEQGLGIAVDTLGNIYIAGVTQSLTNFHTQAPFQAASGGGLDAFVAKIGTPVVIAPGSLALSAAAYNVVESAGSVSITVSRSGGSSGAAAVDYATGNGSATAGSDYTAVSGTLNWADGDSADKTIELTIMNDEQLEPDENFTLNLGNASGAALGTPASATITITNDDAARPGTLQFDAATYFVDESAGSLVVNVTRAGGSDGAASVNYATSPGSATAGSDYQTSSGTLSWADGDAASKSFTVTIGNDAAVEGNETFNLVLSGASGASLGEIKAATATIVDDEAAQPGVIKLGASSYTVAENAGTLSVTVLRDIGSDGAVSVQYTTNNGTATAGGDYTLASGTLSWADGDVSARTISVPIIDDSLFEGAETFGVSLGSATGGALLGSPASATVTITDNDVAASGSLQLDVSSYEVREDGGALRVTVTRANGSDGAVTVRYATSAGTATSNVDFTAAGGTLSWAAGDSAPKTVDIAILQDSLYEGREAFGFALSSPSGGARLGTPSSATITLVDDEVMRGSLQLSDSAFSVAEDGGSVSISVLRSGGSDGAVSVDYASSDASALSPGDYTAVSGTLNWADGDAEPKRIVVPIVDDSDYESTPETFTVQLGSVSGGATQGTPAAATVTILDNEVRPGALQFEAAAYRAAENTGVVKLTVIRVGGTDNAVTARYSTNQGTAVSGSDYNANSGTLSWAAGDATPRVLTIQIIDDAAFEGDETFSVALSEPTGGATLGGPASTTITIADDEVAFSGGLRFGASAYEVDEAAGSIAIAVVRGGSSEGTVSVAYSTVNGQAVSGADYIASSGRLTWADGDMEPKTIAVQILRDSSVEGAENFSVVLSSPTGGVTLDNPSSASIVITDANADDEGSGSSGKGGGGAVDPRWLAVLLAAAMMRAAMHRRGS
ncbi:Calx-beta domain-containing protein [Hydrocarboniphaga sp.]|uniref:Calx-beta domain-containing protein n=1 Tax=Hydrocarboniphaga sp. TaxID=2033016 RepID=UPI003D0A1897